MGTRLTVPNRPISITSYCPRCKRTLPVDRFASGKKKVGEFLLASWCRDCTYSKEYSYNCAQCGESFITLTKATKHCSRSCAQITAPPGTTIKNGYKWCPACRQVLARDLFVNSSGKNTGWCSICISDKGRQYLLGRFGLTVESFQGLLALQGGVCKICKMGSEFPWCLDHDHSCCRDGCPICFRGILCTQCNTLLGYGYDNPEILEAAAEYLQTWNSVSNIETP